MVAVAQLVRAPGCGKKIWRAPKDLKHSKSGKFFCSKSHQTLWRNKVYSGPNHPLWTGGESTYRKTLIENGISPICARCGEKDRECLLSIIKMEIEKIIRLKT